MPKRVFVSSVTAGLGAKRTAVASVLRHVEIDVSDQETTFRQSGGTLLQKLYLELWRVDAAIFLIGDRAGDRPHVTHEQPYQELRAFQQFRSFSRLHSASYTQWEFLFA
jgi:hypothetical protein